MTYQESITNVYRIILLFDEFSDVTYCVTECYDIQSFTAPRFTSAFVKTNPLTHYILNLSLHNF